MVCECQVWVLKLKVLIMPANILAASPKVGGGVSRTHLYFSLITNF